jgi:hypothetical protein
MTYRQLFVPFLITWPSIVFAALTGRIAIGSSAISASEYVGWFFLVLAPVATYLMLMRNRPSRSIAEVLYNAERRAD